VTNVLTLVLGGVAVLGAVLFFVLLARYRRLQRRAREEAAAAAAEAAAAAALAAAEAAAAASDPRDNEVTYPIATHPAAVAAAAAAQAEVLKLVQEMTSPPPYLAKSDPRKVAQRRARRHDMSQPGTPAQRLNKDRGYDPWQPLQDLEVGDDVV